MDLRMHRVLEHDAREVWAVVGERFGDLTWVGDVQSSELEGALEAGAVRTCRFEPNMFSKTGVVRERLLTFDRATRSMSYQALGLTGIFEGAVNRWTVKEVGPGRSRVEMHATIHAGGVRAMLLLPLWPVMRHMGRKTLNELATHLNEASERTRPLQRPSET